ncbi:LADA_0H19020g1_1 [Lachancea dasiensis]|uniref:LADA_0H19020g1_1 n=1 Tax=Lachancea dasiensis TaxID=1072105 RepID=A0A1G4K672_9SACH|nr:LADA_0H19020g1_1 [Lachancea dasiensis]
MEYVFWPDHLSTERNGIRQVIAIRESGTEWLALALLTNEENRALNCDAKGQKLTSIGTWDRGVGFRSHRGHIKMILVQFMPPRLDLMQFYSLEPISLVLPEKDRLMRSPADRKLGGLGIQEASMPNFRLRRTINLMNMYRKHVGQLDAYLETRSDPGQNRMPRLSLYQSTRKYKISILVRYCLSYLVIFVHFVASMISCLLSKGRLSLVNISATAQQIDLRCQQLCYFPVQYFRINASSEFNKAYPCSENGVLAPNKNPGNLRDSYPCDNYPDYIRFYNTVWLIVNDISFGYSLGALLAENRSAIARSLHSYFTKYLFKKVHCFTMTLSQNPLGIKLNGELAQFLSDLFLWIIEFSYSIYIQRITSVSCIELIISILSTASCCFGVTFASSLIVDLLSVLTIHISLFYYISARMYNWQLSVMKSLLYLFYGKKRNVLRNRIDSHLFELDQILMGTLFFTILVFLLPTLMIFYAFFTVLRMVVLLPELLLESVMALLNHFPLFVLLLRLKDPQRIPGGISIHPIKGTDHFRLINNPLTVKRAFRPYGALLTMMVESYFSLSTLRQILIGRPITIQRNRMYQILYSALPDVPVATEDVWTALNNVLW